VLNFTPKLNLSSPEQIVKKITSIAVAQTSWGHCYDHHFRVGILGKTFGVLEKMSWSNFFEKNSSFF
jgi:hypothetical protein